MRKKNDAEVVLACLQADRSRVMNVLRQQRLSELLEATARKGRQWLGHIANISKRRKPSAAIGEFADVFACSAGIESGGKLRRKSHLHRRQHRTPAFRNANNCAIGGKRSDQALQ